MGTLETNFIQYSHTQTQLSPYTQPSSEYTRLMEHQMEIQLETCERMITESKSLAQDVSANTKDGWNNIPSMYKKLLFTMNSEERETPPMKSVTKE